MSKPQSIIHICKGVLLNSSYEHSIYFESEAAQQEFFSGKVTKSFPAYSYIRKSWPLKVAATMEEAMGWSYLYFRNVEDGKYYYYFIEDAEYINDATVELKLVMDVLQTYHFSYLLRPCFVEREHTVSDAFGAHTLDEGLEMGEYVTYYQQSIDMGEMAILVMATINPFETTESYTAPTLCNLFNGVFCGMGVWAVAASDWTQLGQTLENLETWGKIDGIQSIWMYPKNLIELGGESSWSDTSEFFKLVAGAKSTTALIDAAGAMAYNFNGKSNDISYPAIRNNKMYCYPYNILYATNGTGDSAVYKFERFFKEGSPGYDMSAVLPQFRIYGAIAPDASVRLVPMRYNAYDTLGQDSDVEYEDIKLHNYDEGLTSASFPTCAWDADIYKIWMAQNKATQAMTLVGAGAGAVGNVVSGIAGLFSLNPGQGVGNAVNGLVNNGLQVGNLLAQRKDMEVQPPQSRGAHSISVNTVAGVPGFLLQFKSLSPEYAAIIDDYFTRYGYKVNRIGVPRRKNRENYTYVKTVGCLIGGNFCDADKRAIEAIFDHGITFWTNGNAIGSYGDNPTFS